MAEYPFKAWGTHGVARETAIGRMSEALLHGGCERGVVLAASP